MRRKSPLEVAALEHEELPPRAVRLWGHPDNCTYCIDQRLKEVEHELWKGNASTHAQQEEG